MILVRPHGGGHIEEGVGNRKALFGRLDIGVCDCRVSCDRYAPTYEVHLLRIELQSAEEVLSHPVGRYDDGVRQFTGWLKERRALGYGRRVKECRVVQVLEIPRL